MRRQPRPDPAVTPRGPGRRLSAKSMESLHLVLRRSWHAAWERLPCGLLPLRLRLAALARRLLGVPPTGRYDPQDRRGYATWLARHARLDAADRAAIQAHIAALPARPLISLAMGLADVPLPALRASLAAVRAQLWPHWELCIALDPAAPAPVIRLLEEAAERDPRLRMSMLTAGPVGLANAALGMARGAFVLVIEPDGRLAEQALYEVAAAVAAEPDLAVLYADEDRIDAAGRRHAAWLKPEFDPDLLLGQDLFGGFAAYRRDLLRGMAGLREAMGEAAAHDLALRATAAVGPARVRHIPALLWQAGPEHPIDPAAHRRAVAAALDAAGVAARVEPAPLAPQWSRVVRALPDPAPLVSVIVPTRDRAGLLEAVRRRGACPHRLPGDRVPRRRQRLDRAGDPGAVRPAAGRPARPHPGRARPVQLLRPEQPGRRGGAGRDPAAAQQRHRGDRARLAARDGQPRGAAGDRRGRAPSCSMPMAGCSMAAW